MKAKFLALVALVLGLAACQNDFDGANAGKRGEVDFTLSVAVPEMATRAAGDDSAEGGLTNIDLENAWDIRYILEVYDANGELAKERMYSFEDSASQTAFNLRLVPGRPYTFVVWADLVPQAATRDLAENYDYHYNTTAGLTKVMVVEKNWTAIDESRDAYTGRLYVEDFRSTSTINVTLTRPFAKLRVITTDIKELYGELMPETVKVNYINTAFYNEFNALAQDVVGEPAVAGEKVVDLKTMTYTNEEPKEDGKMTLFADYFFRATDDRVMFTMDVQDNTKQDIPTVVFNTNIPVQRNYLTTVMGPVLTDSNNITVTIDDAFAGYNNVGGTVVTTDEELKAALTQNIENISVVLGADLTYDIAAWDKNKMGGDKTKTITISGGQYEPETRAAEPYTLTFKHTNSDWCNVITDATLVFKNINIVSSGYNTGAWNTAHLNLNCNVEMYDVTSTMVNFKKNAIVKNLTVNEVIGGHYAIWATAEGQTISIDGLTVNAANNGSRGIKIADQYVDAPAKVTLNIKNATFNTASKAAILVSSTAGADINLENINIENVAADPINAVWVDEDWAQYDDLVTVTGGTKVLEGSAASKVVTVTNADELKAAIKAAPANATEETTIYLKKGTYQGYFLIENNKKIKITTNEAAVVDGLIDLGGISTVVTLSNLTLTNAHPQTASGNHDDANGYILGAYRGSYVIDNCTFDVVSTGAIHAHAGGVNEYLTVRNSTFNCNGLTPIRSRSNATVDNCTFNDQRRYAIQFRANETATATNRNEYIIFTNNKIVNPTETSGEGFAASVQISHSGKCEYVDLTITGNTMTSSKFTDLKFAYDHEEGCSACDKIKITTCTLNGQPITEGMCFYLDEETYEVSFTMSKPEVEEDATEIVITNAKELFWFANEVNVNKNSFSGKTVKLGEDIDLENAMWTPVGQTGATQFKGTFDGQNYTISNLNIDATAQTGANYSSGIFGWLNAAVVKNVKVNGATVKGNHNVGVIAGYLETAGCTIENCHVVGATVECHHANDDACGDKAGVIVGHAGNSGVAVKDCTATDSTLSAGRDAGQIVGAAKEVNVTGCSATNVRVSANGECTEEANIRNEIIGRLLL